MRGRTGLPGVVGRTRVVRTPGMIRRPRLPRMIRRPTLPRMIRRTRAIRTPGMIRRPRLPRMIRRTGLPSMIRRPTLPSMIRRARAIRTPGMIRRPRLPRMIRRAGRFGGLPTGCAGQWTHATEELREALGEEVVTLQDEVRWAVPGGLHRHIVRVAFWARRAPTLRGSREDDQSRHRHHGQEGQPTAKAHPDLRCS